MTMLDVAAATFVTVVSLVGLVSTVLYQRNLEDQTVRLWQAAGTATATLEDLRADSRSRWASLTSTWEGYSQTTGARTKAPTVEETVTVDVDDLEYIDEVINSLDVDDVTKAAYLEQARGLSAWAHEKNLDRKAKFELVLDVEDKLRNPTTTTGIDGTVTTDDAFSGYTTEELKSQASARGLAMRAQKSSVLVAISDSSDGLDDAAEMWTDGASEPNFYHVNIAAASEDNEFAKALSFQTYITNRTGLDNSEHAVTEGDDGETVLVPPVTFDTYIDAVTPDPTNIAITGADLDLLTMSWENWSSMDLPLKKVKFEFLDGGKMTTMTINGVEVYNGGETGKKDLDVSSYGISIAPGTFDLEILGVPVHDEEPFTGQRVKVKLEFTDGSKNEQEYQL